MDADTFPPETRTKYMARGNSQKKSDWAALVIRSIDANPDPRNPDSFHADLDPWLKADLIFPEDSVGGADRLRNAANQYQSLRYALDDHNI